LFLNPSCFISFFFYCSTLYSPNYSKNLHLSSIGLPISDTLEFGTNPSPFHLNSFFYATNFFSGNKSSILSKSDTEEEAGDPYISLFLIFGFCC
jgi:hypothetical protein